MLGRVLPAYAGMIQDTRYGLVSRGRAPRVCGDDPPTTLVTIGRSMCSPRMRG